MSWQTFCNVKNFVNLKLFQDCSSKMNGQINYLQIVNACPVTYGNLIYPENSAYCEYEHIDNVTTL